MAKLHVVCLRPGPYHRGGARHEGHTVHETGAFTAEQLRELSADPHLAVILEGETLTEDHIAALTAKPAKAKG